MNYSAILFDLDGTVLDTLGDLHAAANACLRRFGYPERSLAEVRRFVGNGSRRLLELAMPGADAAALDAALAWYKPWYDAHCAVLTRPYPGVEALLGRLRAAGLKLALVSNKPDATVRALAEVCFPGLFDLALGENEAAGLRRKPWPDMVLEAVSRLGAAREDCLYVGDSEVDLLTARNALLPCASVSWGFRDRAELLAAGADPLFDDPAALGDWILSQGRLSAALRPPVS